uniref:solute carrier family 25 member 48-like isoform X1 n=2 Tax=Ciona intestinalis TaxID=7719 RepID=UPI00089DB98E|nr:solute carrier family 25 member 48-like isoform X1 [Ciona intestinalis]XP_026696558.1 solute carrier family 25 member 48-like isoform X1 [Ciona intestinalis]|eukprot:XP_018672942.1 solute carrier family 25 member 48-like isoform X1 [Ciona intestinalis]
MKLHGDAFVAGWVGGAASVLVSHPLDTVKVRLQTNSAYRGAVHCIIKTFTREGVKGFYRGMSFPLASAAAYNALVFGVYSNTVNFLCHVRYGDANHVPGCSDIFIGAMMAGGVSVSVGTPIDLIKIRLQTQTNVKKTKIPNKVLTMPKSLHRGNATRAMATSPLQPKVYSGPMQCTRDIYQNYGLRGMYRGASSMLIRDIPGYALYFVPYELFRSLFKPEEGRVGAASALLAGGLAGTISWGVMNPVDTIKSRLQADIGVKAQKYDGFLQCVRSSYQSEGYSVFLRGMGMNALRGFPQSAALFFGYEMALNTIMKLRSK